MKNIEDFRIPKEDLERYLKTLPDDWASHVVENEWNVARVFYEFCRQNSLLLDIRNPDHFEYFLHMKAGVDYVKRMYMKRYDMPFSTGLGITRKVWTERFFHPSLLRAAGFNVIPLQINIWGATEDVIEWGSSDKSLSTFGPGNPPYDCLVKILEQTIYF